MGKDGIKDPTPSRSSYALKCILSKTTFAAIGTTFSFHITPRILSKFGYTSYIGNTYNNSVGFNSSLFISSGKIIVGLGLGIGVHVTLCKARLKLIQWLLAYHGWLYQPKSKKTMIWGLLLKLLVGPGPHRTFEFQKIMPKLPIPKVEESCERYLNIVRPLLTKEDYEVTDTLVNQFLDGDAQVLQKYLLEKDRQKANWLADWWTESAYLARRDSIAINVNFFMTSQFLDGVSCDPISRCATNLYNAMRYQDMITHENLPPDLIMGTIPVCMDGVRFLFSSCRIPGAKTDRLEKYPESTHAVAISKGEYYRIEMYEKDHKGKLSPVSKLELKNQLDFIVNDTKDLDVSKKNAVAALTTQNRTVWAQHREMLLSNPMNAAILKDIESAIFILIIGDESENPKDISDMAKCALAGNGTDKWFDKSNNLQICTNTMGMSNMEHTGADATHFAVMWEHALQMESYGADGLIPRRKDEVVRSLNPPKRLNWSLDYMQDVIGKAYSAYKERVDALDVLVYHTEYGKNYMKSRKVSPDGFLQMAIQLAYWRMHNEITKTYEPASTRLFAFGRTDNINPVSDHSIKWTVMMDDNTSTRESIIKIMQKAIAYQSQARLEATAGYGCERHLLGLSVAAKELGIEQPALFADKAFHLPMKLSTSQVPTNIGNRGILCIPESLFGGFGPGCEDGYGMLYCTMGDNMFNFTITSWKTCPETDSRKFADALNTALNDMRDLMDGKGKYSECNGTSK